MLCQNAFFQICLGNREKIGKISLTIEAINSILDLVVKWCHDAFVADKNKNSFSANDKKSVCPHSFSSALLLPAQILKSMGGAPLKKQKRWSPIMHGFPVVAGKIIFSNQILNYYVSINGKQVNANSHPYSAVWIAFHSSSVSSLCFHEHSSL